MSLPIGMYRRAFSYDDALEDPTPMTPPPSDMGSIPWKPVIPERKYQHLAKVPDATDCFWQARPLCFPSSAPEAFSGSGPHRIGWSPILVCVQCLSWCWWAFFSCEFKWEWSCLLPETLLCHPSAGWSNHANYLFLALTEYLTPLSLVSHCSLPGMFIVPILFFHPSSHSSCLICGIL